MPRTPQPNNHEARRAVSALRRWKRKPTLSGLLEFLDTAPRDADLARKIRNSLLGGGGLYWSQLRGGGPGEWGSAIWVTVVQKAHWVWAGRDWRDWEGCLEKSLYQLVPLNKAWPEYAVRELAEAWWTYSTPPKSSRALLGIVDRPWLKQVWGALVAAAESVDDQDAAKWGSALLDAPLQWQRSAMADSVLLIEAWVNLCRRAQTPARPAQEILQGLWPGQAKQAVLVGQSVGLSDDDVSGWVTVWHVVHDCTTLPIPGAAWKPVEGLGPE